MTTVTVTGRPKMTELTEVLSPVLSGLRQRWLDCLDTAWGVSIQLAGLEMDATQPWKAHGFAGLRQWAAYPLKQGGLGIGDVSYRKMVRMGKVYLNDTGEGQKEWLECPFWEALELVQLCDTEEGRNEARFLAKSGKGRAALRRAVASKRPDQHLDADWRTIPSVSVPVAVHEQWKQVVNVVRYQLEQRDPSLGQVVEFLLVEYLNGWQIPTQDRFAVRVAMAMVADGDDAALDPDASPSIQAVREFILIGKARCVDPRGCVNWSTAELQPHHVTLRSHKAKQKPGSVVPLCGPCLEYWQPRWGDLERELGL